MLDTILHMRQKPEEICFDDRYLCKMPLVDGVLLRSSPSTQRWACILSQRWMLRFFMRQKDTRMTTILKGIHSTWMWVKVQRSSANWEEADWKRKIRNMLDGRAKVNNDWHARFWPALFTLKPAGWVLGFKEGGTAPLLSGNAAWSDFCSDVTVPFWACWWKCQIQLSSTFNRAPPRMHGSGFFRNTYKSCECVADKSKDWEVYITCTDRHSFILYHPPAWWPSETRFEFTFQWKKQLAHML